MTGKVHRIVRLMLVALAVALVCVLFSESAPAQCVMCRASLSANSNFVRHLNIGTLVLLVPPVSIFCAIFFLAFRLRKSG
ncbi:MAG TPA: hypothetical protein VEM96_09240 [Pyrinomonadaceae bacterium]|nr:hypothetical protein [Pyrinomonadaceae bacterium]